MPPAHSVAEVGAGGGQLALALAARGVRMVVTEASEAGFRRLPPGLDCRLGLGLGVLRPGEVEGVILAGLGGRTIRRILTEGAEVAHSLEWVLLQPQQHPGELIHFLKEAGYGVLREVEVTQGRYTYRVLLARPPR